MEYWESCILSPRWKKCKEIFIICESKVRSKISEYSSLPLSALSATYCQLQSENTKWKIPEIIYKFEVAHSFE